MDDIAVAGDVIAAVDDQAGLACVGELAGQNSAGEACANDEIIGHY